MSCFAWPQRCCATNQALRTQPSLLVPGQYRRARNPLFCFGKVHNLLENFVLQSLAAQSPFKLFNPSHRILKIRGRDNRFLGTHSHQRTFHISFAPLKTIEHLTNHEPLPTTIQNFLVHWSVSQFQASARVSTSTRLGLIEDIIISIVVFLVVNLRNTDGTLFQGANSPAYHIFDSRGRSPFLLSSSARKIKIANTTNPKIPLV